MRLTLTVLVAASFAVLGAGAAMGQSRFDTELQNLRALPFGYTSWCEEGNLVFRSRSSARFRITGAALCIGKPDGYVICSPGAEPRPGPGAQSTPSCSNVTAPDA